MSAIINCNVALPFEIDFRMAFFETFLQKQTIVFMSVLRLTSSVRLKMGRVGAAHFVALHAFVRQFVGFVVDLS